MSNSFNNLSVVTAARNTDALVRYRIPAIVLYIILIPSAYGQEPSPPAGFVALFNGRDLSGWSGRPHVNPVEFAALDPAEQKNKQPEWDADFAQHWIVEDGEIVNDGHGIYCTTDKDFGDFELLVDWKMVGAGTDSGIYLRGCPQVQIWDPANESQHKNGSQLGSGGLWNNNPGAPGKDPLVKADKPVGEWNTFRIRVVGDRVTVHLNDKLVVDDAVMHNYWHRDMPLYERGPIQLQTHGGEMRFRNVFVRELGSKQADSEFQNQQHRLKWLQDNGFGLFVHWSVDSQLGSVISHSLVGASEDYTKSYLNELPKTFNPRHWNPDELAELAKICGAKYVVFTAKHHNGFCMWDTKTTKFNIMNTPYGKDIVRQYVDAVRRQGLAVGLYYSPEDFLWMHENEFEVTRDRLPFDPDTHPPFVKLVEEQTRELLTNFGKIDVLFIDGEGEAPVKRVAWSLQPDCLITRGAIETPEQYIPGKPPEGAWESCFTMGTQWQYKPTNEVYKSGTEIIEMLIETRAKGGALLLNVGPMPDGRTPIEQESRLREVALWMAVNNKAIFNSRPWTVTNEGDIWFTKSKDSDTVYAFLTGIPDWERGTRREFRLRSVAASNDTKINVLGQSGRVVEYMPDVDATSRFTQTPDGLAISVVRAQRLYNDHKWPNPVVVEITNARPAKLNSHAEGEPNAAREWIDVIGPSGPDGILSLAHGVTHCGDVQLSDKPGELATLPGAGIVAATSTLNSSCEMNLHSKEYFGDCEVELEFLLAKNSNSGVKLQQRYEIQLYDSHGHDQPTALECGGVYPHWVYRADGKSLKYLDQGVPPIVNAAKPAGEWQTLSIVFQAPRFDENGKKTGNARLESVVLNGQVVQQDVELDSPTGNAATPRAETPRAPLLLQMDHGAVAFRNVRVRPR
jgi:alpha-L-fucosidase